MIDGFKETMENRFNISCKGVIGFQDRSIGVEKAACVLILDGFDIEKRIS
jgi:hypothetical protein